MTRRAVLVLVLLTAAAVVTAAAAMLPITSTAPLQVFDAAGPATTTPPPSTTAPTTPPDPGDGTEKVWVCVILVEGVNAPRLKPGLNPLHVAVTSQEARDALSPDHLSYVVPTNDVRCAVDGKPATRPTD